MIQEIINNLGLEVNILITIVGMVLGSFYNVVALRVLEGQSLNYPPSHCCKCKHRLKPLDLIPVFSYIALKGRCRYCGEKISAIYPFGELLTAVSYLIVINKFGYTLETLINLIFITVMILATVADLKERVVPDRFVIIGVISVLILRIITGENLKYYIVSGIGAFTILLLISILSRGKMGGADIKLYGLIGLSIGINGAIISLIYASYVALIVNIKKVIHWKEGRSVEIPFVPFITIGILGTFIYSIKIIPGL